MANRGPFRRGKVSSATSGAVRRGRALDQNDPTVGGGTGGTGGGTPGPTGPAGPAGADGAPGAPGAAGATGATGAAGQPGFEGSAGLEGEWGPPGPPGKDGKDGSPAPPLVIPYDDLESLSDPGFLPMPLETSQLLDKLGPPTVGDILVRTAQGWGRLAAPAVGFFLGGNGAATAPSYQGILGFASPLAQASHIDYSANPANAIQSNRGTSVAATGTIITYPAAGSIRSEGGYFQLGTSAATNSSGAISTTTGSIKDLSFAWDFDASFVIITDSVSIATTRYILAVSVNNENTDPVTANFIGFMYDTGSSGDVTTKWCGVTYDGTQAKTAGLVAVVANTRYVLRIRKVAGTVFFSVNGGAETSTTSHVPVNNAYCGFTMRVTALTTSARSMWFSRLWCDYGT